MIIKQKLSLIKNLLNQSYKEELTFSDWLIKQEYLLILALVAAKVKPGATLPKEFFDQEDLNLCLDLLKKLNLISKTRKFKNFWIIDVAITKQHLKQFEKDRFGEFYGYPNCCIESYQSSSPKITSDISILEFVGLVPCTSSCPKAIKLSQKYHLIFKQILPPTLLTQLFALN
jgi:hypothetical protein